MGSGNRKDVFSIVVRIRWLTPAYRVVVVLRQSRSQSHQIRIRIVPKLSLSNSSSAQSPPRSSEQFGDAAQHSSQVARAMDIREIIEILRGPCEAWRSAVRPALARAGAIFMPSGALMRNHAHLCGHRSGRRYASAELYCGGHGLFKPVRLLPCRRPKSTWTAGHAPEPASCS